MAPAERGSVGTAARPSAAARPSRCTRGRTGRNLSPLCLWTVWRRAVSQTHLAQHRPDVHTEKARPPPARVRQGLQPGLLSGAQAACTRAAAPLRRPALSLRAPHAPGAAPARAHGAALRLCGQCAKAFCAALRRAGHQHIHTGEGESPPACAALRQGLPLLLALLQHPKRAAAQRPCTCGQCAKAFTQTRTWAQHRGVLRAKPFACAGDAARASARALAHREHGIRRAKPFACAQCGKAFTQVSPEPPPAHAHRARPSRAGPAARLPASRCAGAAPPGAPCRRGPGKCRMRGAADTRLFLLLSRAPEGAAGEALPLRRLRQPSAPASWLTLHRPGPHTSGGLALPESRQGLQLHNAPT